MTPNSNSSGSPGEATAGRPRPGVSPPVETPGGLPSPRPEARGEFRHIAYVIVGLGALVVLLLSAGIYQSTRSLVVERRREELATRTDRKRQAARDRIHELEKHARSLAGEPNLRGWVVSAQGGLDPAARRRLTTELGRAAGSFGFHSVAACAPDGRLIAGTSAGAQGESVPSRGQGQALGPQKTLGGFHRVRENPALLSFALPVAGTGAPDSAAVLVFELRAAEALAPALGGGMELGRDAGAYLVAKSGPDVVFLSAPPRVRGAGVGDRARLSDPDARAAAMAATGVEGTVEWKGPSGRRLVAATRDLPEFGWGLVGQMDAATLVQGTRNTLVALLALDLALVALTFTALWLWRRQYSTGLARREMELSRQHAERVQAVFDTAFDAILTFDREGHVRTLNRAAERMFGPPASAIVDLPIHRVLAWGPSGRSSGDLPVPGAVCRAEVCRAGGAPLPVEFSIGTSGEGDAMVYTAIVRDIGERVAAERQIREFAEGLELGNRRLADANAQLEEASRLKSEFLAHTSHELRTPLNGVIGFLQLVLDGLGDSREEELDFLKQAVQCSRQLLGLINDVLDIAK